MLHLSNSHLAVGAVLTLLALGGASLVFGVGIVRPTEDIVRYLIAWGLLDLQGGLKLNLVVKTADYTVVAPTATLGDPSGTQFTTRGAGGAVNFTLPAPSVALIGCTYEFHNTVDQNMTVTAGAGKAVTFNNAAAASLAASTAGQKIGAHIKAVCDGTSWHLIGDRIGVTYTVA
jgi:hypothetical protein